MERGRSDSDREFRKGNKIRVTKFALALFAGLAVWLGAVGWWIATGPPERPEDRATTAIVLGAAVIGDEPSPVFAARIDHAISLYQEGRVNRLFFTGARSPEDLLSEAAAAREYAIAAGVPAEAISIEEVSRTTYQNLTETRRAMRIVSFPDVIIVSDPLHLRRASIMANGLGFEAKTSATPTTRYRSWSTKGPFLLRELYFVHHYWVFGE